MKEEMIAIPQNIFIASVIKGMTNIKANSKPFLLTTKDGDIIPNDFRKRKGIGTEYKITYSKLFETDKKNKEKQEVRLGITFKNFFIEDQNTYPKFTDKHLKMILYLLQQKESEIEFLATDFNKLCGLIKDSVNTESAYKILEDLTSIEIRIINDENEFIGEMEFFSLLQIIKKRMKIKNISFIKLLNQNGIETEETLSRAKLRITELIDFDNVGTMYVPKEFFELKIDKTGNLGATSLAYNLLYIASVNKDKNKTTYTYNVSTVLNWIGVTENDYKEFFDRNKSKTHKYYVSKLERLFHQLETCGIKAELKGVKVKNKNEFYLKEQVIVDLTVFKNNLMKQS
ncbi:MAG: hypothetical protein J6D47_10525 [Peptostreptococcaceae bacterium]|nr:hypothetical protein [Peptostreptococcaceae bacterium]